MLPRLELTSPLPGRYPWAMSPTRPLNPRARVGSPFEHVAPEGGEGGAEEMVKDLKAAVFAGRGGRMLVGRDGKRDVRVV